VCIVFSYLQGSHFSVISENPEMSGNSDKVSEKSGKGPRSAKGQGICVVREIWLWQFNKMLVTKLWCTRIQSQLYGHVLRSSNLYSYCNSFFICDVHREFGVINVHLFDILRAISSRKVGGKVMDFFVVFEFSLWVLLRCVFSCVKKPTKTVKRKQWSWPTVG